MIKSNMRCIETNMKEKLYVKKELIKSNMRCIETECIRTGRERVL